MLTYLQYLQCPDTQCKPYQNPGDDAFRTEENAVNNTTSNI